MPPPLAIGLLTNRDRWPLRAKSPEPPAPFILCVPPTWDE
jgi:hypothetical protein